MDLRDDVKRHQDEAGLHERFKKEPGEWKIPFNRDSMMIVIDGGGDPGPENPDAPEQYVSEPGLPPKKVCGCCFYWTIMDADPPETRAGVCCTANLCCCFRRCCKRIHCVVEFLYVVYAWLLQFICCGKVRLPEKRFYKNMNLHIQHHANEEGELNGMVMSDMRFDREEYTKVNDRLQEKRSREGIDASFNHRCFVQIRPENKARKNIHGGRDMN